MKKILPYLLCMIVFGGCAKHDPILPGARSDIFGADDVIVQNREVPDLIGDEKNISGDTECPYRQDITNNIFKDDIKIWSGFATRSAVKSNQSPICDGKFIYTGLSTGEVIKVNATTKRALWVTDVFRANNLTGGASIVDIVAHVGLDGNYVYAGGLGDAFCKLNANNGNKIWCVNISVATDFIIVDDFIFVVDTDNNLYAINTKQGDVYWKSVVKKQVKPKYNKKFIIVGNQYINYKNGNME